ncbi:unnamed protein product [Urochloa decumbens]|uniref:Uncharacterized protein n=1 Tax=Urochloa decumbens TaxID=240449 RepID=A0ABC9G2D5_9POAL
MKIIGAESKMNDMTLVSGEETALADAAQKGKKDAAKMGKEDAAQKGKEDATENLLSSVRNYSIFLYVGTMVSSLAPRAAAKYAPDAVVSAQRFLAGGGYDLSVTVAFFAGATLLLQAHLARVLKPSARPRLTPLAAWPLAAVTWLCITNFFLNCLAFGGGYGEWAAAAGASVANLVMSARTVMRHLA